MAVYERRTGGHVAERVRPEPGSEDEKRLAALAEAGTGNWVLAEPDEPAEPEAKRPAKTDNKAAWVDWAVVQGADRAEAEKSTKDDLITAYGG